MIIIRASLYCQLLERPLQEPYRMNEPNEWTPWPVRARKPMWIQEEKRNNRHDLHSKTASREMPGTECGPLHDLCRPYLSISHCQSWRTLENYGNVWLSCQIHSMGQQFHDGMLARVQNDGEFSDPFPVTNGVKQGYVLASTLSSMMFSAMLTDAFRDGDNSIPIRLRYRFDGKLFNLRRLQAISKVQTEVLDEFLFADDMAKGAPTEEKMQKGVDQVFDSVTAMISQSIKKTEVVYQPIITVKGHWLQVVDKFTYLWKQIVYSCAYWWWS